MVDSGLSDDVAAAAEPGGDLRADSEPAELAASLETCAFLRLAREWDLRFERLFRQGAVAKWYSSVGHEATTVSAGAVLEAGDALFSLHRDSGAILRYYVDIDDVLPGLVPGARSSRGRDSRELLHRLASQLLGRAAGFSRGYERSFHYAHIDEPAGIFHVGMISHLGAMIPVAAGVALGFRHQGRRRVALNFIGDGGTSTGDFHEGLNMAAVLGAPFVLVVENNGYAFSTPLSQQSAAPSLAARAQGYGMVGVRVDGNDPEVVGGVLREAVTRARAGEGPTLVEAMVGRMRGHSEGDRSLDGVPSTDRERYLREDPVEGYERSLLERGAVTREWLDELRSACSDLLIDVVDRALESSGPGAGERRPVFLEPSVEVEDPVPDPAEDGEGDGDEVTYLEGISTALRDAMREDTGVFLMGQDIAGFGGAFTVTRGFVEEFGDDRVINTPIAESGTLGMAVGCSLLGRRPVVEMQFADFVSCGFNQLVNVAAKLFYRTERPVPLVVRLPSGGGVGAGTFHSQNVEAWFLHVPGLKVVAPSTVQDAYTLLREAISDPNPVLFVEHKYLYRRASGAIGSVRRRSFEAGVSARAAVVREGKDATIIAYGWMAHRALDAARALESEGLDVEVVDLRVLAPLDDATILASVERTGRVLVVHEAPRTGGFGGEIVARIADIGFEHLDAPVRRLAYPDTPVPFDKGLEAECLPSEETIASAVRALCRW